MGKEWDKLTRNLMNPISEADKKRKAEYNGNYAGRRSNLPDLSKSGGIDAQQFHQQWAEQALRVLKPGGYLLAFGGDRTHHRLTCGLEDAGFEIRTCITWNFGSGFPKNLNISKQLTKLLPSNLQCVCADHSMNTNIDSQDDYQNGYDLCDELPPLDSNTDQDAFPLPSDAHEHNHDGLHEDDLNKALEYNLGHLGIDLLSTEDSSLLLEHLLKVSPTLRNMMSDTLKSKSPSLSMESHKKDSHIFDKSSSVYDSVSSLSYSNSPIGSITRTYHKCNICGLFFATQGIGTALKPAVEFIVMCRKPLSEKNVASNVLK